MMVGHLWVVTFGWSPLVDYLWLITLGWSTKVVTNQVINQVGHNQPTSPIPFRAADQRLLTSPMVKSATNRRHRWNRPCSADWDFILLLPQESTKALLSTLQGWAQLTIYTCFYHNLLSVRKKIVEPTTCKIISCSWEIFFLFLSHSSLCKQRFS